MTEESPSTTIALVPPSLVPLAPLPPTDRETYISDTAMELQKTGGRPDSTGAFVFFHLGPEWVDRITEIMGRVGSAGEQLAIALATNRDARRWTAPDASGMDVQFATMAVRAQAEMTAMWTLSAAHGLANALVRLLLLDADAAKVLTDARPNAKGFPPFSEDQAAWVSFEPTIMKVARRAAAASPSPAVVVAARALSSLFGDKRWDDLLDLRNVGFHRWRPQTVDGGTPKASSVTISATSRSISVGVGPSNVAPDIETTLKIAEAGLSIFAKAARTFDECIHAAINELSGKELFQI